MSLQRHNTASATPEGVPSIFCGYGGVTSLSVPEEGTSQQEPRADPDSIQSSSTSIKASEPPQGYLRSSSPATVQSGSPLTPETSPSRPSPTGSDVPLDTSQVAEATTETSWPPPFPRLSASMRWSDLADSDDEETPSNDVPWSEAPQQPNSSLIPSYSGVAAIRAASDDDRPDSVQTVSPDESPTPLVAQSSPFVAAEPVRTTIGFSLPLVPVPENSSSSVAAPSAAVPVSSRGEHLQRVSSTVPSPCASSLESPMVSGAAPHMLGTSPPVSGVDSAPRRGYAGALTMLYSAAHASAEGTSRSAKVGQARVEAVLPVDNDEQVKLMVRSAARGFLAEQEPQAPREGMGGTYFLQDEHGEPAAIFKPCDEEPLAPNNPKGWAGRALGAPGMKPSVRVGEAALREVAAYLLDYRGFAGVPPACLVLCRHSKLNYTVSVPKIESIADFASISSGQRAATRWFPTQSAIAADLPECDEEAEWNGASLDGSCRLVRTHLSVPALPGGYKLGSLQSFATHKCDANDFSPSVFSADNVHRIGILDIRLLNTDRHAGNLLVAEVSSAGCPAEGPSSVGSSGLRAPYQLIPIDHGFALPEALEGPYFEWMFWPQTSVPFSEEVRAYVANLDAKADIAMLRQRLPTLRTECLRCLEVTTLVLKACTAAGLNLFELASLFTRPTEHVPSDFEALCMDARENALRMSDPPCNSKSRPSRTTPAPHSVCTNKHVSLELLPSAGDGVDSDEDDSYAGEHGRGHLLEGLSSTSGLPADNYVSDMESGAVGRCSLDDVVPPGSGAADSTSLQQPHPLAVPMQRGFCDSRGSCGSTETCEHSAMTLTAAQRGPGPGLAGAMDSEVASPDLLFRNRSMMERAEAEGLLLQGDDRSTDLPGLSREIFPTSPALKPLAAHTAGTSGVLDSPCMAVGSAGQSPGGGAGTASAPRPIESPWLRTGPIEPASARSPTSSFAPSDALDQHTSASAFGETFASIQSAARNKEAAGGLRRDPVHCMSAIGALSANAMPDSCGQLVSTRSVAMVTPPPAAAALVGASRNVRQRRRNAWRGKRGGRGAGVYPPLLMAAHPEQACYVFSGMNEEQWEVFVECVDDFVSEELHKGTWRVRRSSGPVAGSCPEPTKRF